MWPFKKKICTPPVPLKRVLVWELGELGLNWYPKNDYVVLDETEDGCLLKNWYPGRGNKWITKNGKFYRCEAILSKDK